METVWKAALWQQFGAAIDTLDNLLVACPDALWTERLWSEKSNHTLPAWFPREFPEFWYLTYHTLVWLDLYFAGIPEEQFAPPAPFAQGVIDTVESMPDQPYTKEQLRTYLTSLRHKCHTTLSTLTDEQAHRLVEYPWTGGQPISYLELIIYNLRHVQEHAAYLSLFLGQHDIPDDALGTVTRAKGEPESH